MGVEYAGTPGLSDRAITLILVAVAAVVLIVMVLTAHPADRGIPNDTIPTITTEGAR